MNNHYSFYKLQSCKFYRVMVMTPVFYLHHTDNGKLSHQQLFFKLKGISNKYIFIKHLYYISF